HVLVARNCRIDTASCDCAGRLSLCAPKLPKMPAGQAAHQEQNPGHKPSKVWSEPLSDLRAHKSEGARNVGAGNVGAVIAAVKSCVAKAFKQKATHQGVSGIAARHQQAAAIAGLLPHLEEVGVVLRRAESS